MGRGLDRTEWLRIDCPTCRGKGYTVTGAGEVPCDTCGSSGMVEKEVPFKFDGKRSPEDIAEIFGIAVDQVKDAGHSDGV